MPSELRIQVEDIARSAGALLREELYRPDGPRGSGSHADADTEAERLIEAALGELVPEAGYLGEELGRTRPVGKSGLMWVVDPNDGTSSFMKRRRGSAVSIALLERGAPILGAVYAFAFPDDRGDMIAWHRDDADPRVHRNGVPVDRAWPAEVSAYDIALVSASAEQRPAANAAAVAPLRFRAMPSIAYRLALAAVGEGELAVSINAVASWDIAGGHAILLGAGGVMTDRRGEPVAYGPDGDRPLGDAFGGAPRVVEAVRHGPWGEVQRAAKTAPALEPRARQVAPDLLSRAQGCLLGQLAGDALGSLVEFQSAREIARRYPDGVRELCDGGTWNTLAGQPTDDSELALSLARSLAERGTFDAGDVRDRYRFWLASDPFDVGNTTRAGLTGRPNADSQANGALMRISPLGIFGAGRDAEEVARWAAADAALTHPHPICQQASGLFARTIAHAVRTGCGADALSRAALGWASELDPAIRDAVAALVDRPFDGSGQGWVLLALSNAFHQLRTAPDPEAGIVDTVMRGGDTDTTAAIAGALIGAVHGRDAIPLSWRRALASCRPLPGSPRPRPAVFWPVDALALAEALLAA